MAQFLIAMFFLLFAASATDWTDCENTTPCKCKWSNGKKTAYCQKQGLNTVPKKLDETMQVLDLSRNFIQKLPKNAFKNVGLLNLQRIYLSEAEIHEVDKDAFNDLKILVEIDLSNNEIKILHPETFYGSERLRILYLNGNPLKRLVKHQFPTLPHLRNLELDNCQLEEIHKEAFNKLKALETLNLRYNLLKNLSESIFMNFANLKTLLLEGNPWRCDCNLRVFRDWFLSSKLNPLPLSCSEPPQMVGMHWEDVKSADFACAPGVVAWPSLEVQAQAGGNVTFGCHIKGDPEPKVSWQYEGYPINHTWLVVEAEEGLLDKWTNITIFNVSDMDVGMYTCVSVNSLDTVAVNISLVMPEVVTATTLSKTSNSKVMWWGVVGLCGLFALSTVIAVTVVCCARKRMRGNMQPSVSFTDQEKKLLDVSIATTTDRGTGSSEAIGPDVDLVDPVHITIEREPLPLVVFPPPPEFSTSTLPAGAYGNIFISVSVSRDPTSIDFSRCPDLLDLPHRPKPIYHGMATLPRRPHATVVPNYDNMGPRVTAGGSSTWSLPDASGGTVVPDSVAKGGVAKNTVAIQSGVAVTDVNSQQTLSVVSPNPEFVSL